MDPFHVSVGAPWAQPWAVYTFGESGGALSLDYAQVENYHSAPGSHLNDDHIRTGMVFEPMANSPPIWVLQSGFDPASNDTATPGAGGAPQPQARHWPAKTEQALCWIGAMTFAPSVLNFVIEPPTYLGTSYLDGIASQGVYAEMATRLMPALMPDLTDDATAPFVVSVEQPAGGHCEHPSALPARAGQDAVDFSQRSSVLAMGMRQHWRAGGNATADEVFCAFVVVVNLCSTPAQYTLTLEPGVLPPTVEMAQHELLDDYNLRVRGGALAEDIIEGYGSAVLRFGCDGWTPDGLPVPDSQNGGGRRV